MPPFAGFFSGVSGQDSPRARPDPRHLCADHVEYFVSPAPVGIDHELVPFANPGRSTRARIPRRANTPYSVPPAGTLAAQTRPLSAIRPDNHSRSHIQHPRNVRIDVDAEDRGNDSFEMDAEGYLERSNLPLPAYPDDVPVPIRRGTRPAASVMNADAGPRASGSEALIPRPEGEVGRPRSGGYSLKDQLGLEDKVYESIRTFINQQVDAHLNCRAPLTAQDPTDLELVRNNTSNAYSFFSRYEKKWPIDDFIRAHLKSTKSLLQQRDTREENALLNNQMNQMNNRRPNLRSADTARG